LGDLLVTNHALTDLDVSNNFDSGGGGMDGPSFAAGICRGLAMNKTLIKLNISGNSIRGEDIGRTFSTALYGNRHLKELDISLNGSSVEFASEFSNGLGANKSLRKFTFSGHSINHEGEPEEGKAVTLTSKMKSADFSNKNLGVSGAIFVFAWLSSGKDREALSKITFGDAVKVTLETHVRKVDLEKKCLGLSGAIILAAFLPKCWGLAELNVASNSLRDAGAKFIATALKNHNTTLTKLNLTNNALGRTGGRCIKQALKSRRHTDGHTFEMEW
jgi:Ran GTPase-activating protein (RanGAP) involved in mRNA processing and transport